MNAELVQCVAQASEQCAKKLSFHNSDFVVAVKSIDSIRSQRVLVILIEEDCRKSIHLFHHQGSKLL